MAGGRRCPIPARGEDGCPAVGRASNLARARHARAPRRRPRLCRRRISSEGGEARANRRGPPRVRSRSPKANVPPRATAVKTAIAGASRARRPTHPASSLLAKTARPVASARRQVLRQTSAKGASSSVHPAQPRRRRLANRPPTARPRAQPPRVAPTAAEDVAAGGVAARAPSKASRRQLRAERGFEREHRANLSRLLVASVLGALTTTGQQPV